MNADANDTGQTREEVPGHRLIEEIKELINHGNAKAVRVRTEDGKIFLEIPLTPAAITGGVVVVAAPWLAVLAAIAGLVARVRLEVVEDIPADKRTEATGETARDAKNAA
jgi:hypothetical protein